jgi:hypothetical protein
MSRSPSVRRRLSLAVAALVVTGAAVASCSSDTTTADPNVVPGQAGGSGGVAGASSPGGSAAGAAGESADGGTAAATNSGGKSGASGASDGAGQGGAAGRADLPTECPADGPGAKMVRIERGDGQAACIDEREVTQGEYHAFIEAVGLEGYRAMGFCTEAFETRVPWDQPEPNHADDDTHEYGICQHGWYQPEKTPTMAMGCLFACQAESYCAWAGKQLCGRFDSDEPLDETSALDPKESVWAAACTNGGTTEQSQASKDPNVCGKKWENGAGDVVDASPEAHPECHGQGPYAGIYSLGGGVGEYINGMSTQTATVRSGPLAMGPSAQKGAYTTPTACGICKLGFPAWGLGFRCCQRLQAKE